MAAVIAQTLRPHVRRFGDELAVREAGLRALASSIVPDPRVRWSRLRFYATDDGLCIFEVVQAVAIDPKTFVWQSVMLCLLSSRFRRIEHQTRWTCTLVKMRGFDSDCVASKNSYMYEWRRSLTSKLRTPSSQRVRAHRTGGPQHWRQKHRKQRNGSVRIRHLPRQP